MSPQERFDEVVTELVGTPMKEWLRLDPESQLVWMSLAREALNFAGSPEA